MTDNTSRTTSHPSTHERPSTPTHVGAASRSEQLEYTGTRIEDLDIYIYNDVKQAEKCIVDDMLRGLLRLVTDQTSSSPDLLKDCIDKVLDICNGKAPRTPGTTKPASDIKVHLQECAAASAEEGMYQSFVNGCNIALAHLKNVTVAGTRTAEHGMGILFQRNDPNIIYQEHKGSKSRRKPDVVICRFEDTHHFASNAQPATTSWENYVLEAASKKPNGLRWFHVLSSVEMKRTKQITAQSFGPYIYSSAPSLTKPQYILESPPPNLMDLPSGPPSGSREGATSNQPSSVPSAVAGSGPRKRRRKQSPQPPRGNANSPEHIGCQVAFYAAESFAANLGCTRVINFVVRNSIIYIWYYDRQGIIQSSGIDYLQDLPRFLVLLYALQRMDIGAYGRHHNFQPKIEGEKHNKRIVSYKLNAEIGGRNLELELNAATEARITHFGLKSRATNVLPITSFMGFSPGADGEGRFVAKISWPEEQRVDEITILSRVKEIADTHPEVNGHVLEPVLSHVFKDSTFGVRNDLGISKSEKGSRNLYVLVFPELSPITNLKDDELLEAWKHCILCHRHLWINGVHHRDVSSGNLMYRRDNGQVVGILIDFDLASLSTSEGPQGNQRTGTTPFMALDLLTDEAMAGRVEHIYRHDLESFAWTLVWIVLRYRDGKLRLPGDRKLDDWAKADAKTCGDLKSHFLLKRSDQFLQESSKASNLALNCLHLIASLALSKDKRRWETGEEEMRDDDIFDYYHMVIFEDIHPYTLQL